MADENKFGELKTTLIKAKTNTPEDAAQAQRFAAVEESLAV